MDYAKNLLRYFIMRTDKGPKFCLFYFVMGTDKGPKLRNFSYLQFLNPAEERIKIQKIIS